MDYRDYGFKAPQSGLANSAKEAVRLAESIGYPLVMKIDSPDILHKTDIGGVALNIGDAQAVEKAYETIMANVMKHHPDASIRGVSVEEMIHQGEEIIIGLINDRQFGPVVMFGLGGIFVNVMEDVAFRVLPLSREDAREMIHEIKGYPILSGYRGREVVSEEMLIDLLMKASQIGMDMGEDLDSVDFNPIAVWGDDHRVLDAKFVYRDQPLPVRENMPDTSFMDTFFSAKSIAVVGASSDTTKPGGAVMDILVNHDYQGKVIPVNPKRDEVMDIKAYPNIADIPDQVDLVVVVIPLAYVPPLLPQCAQKGIHNMVILSGGGKELQEEGSVDIEAQIKAAAKEHGVRVIGCNCVGVFDGETRLDTLFLDFNRLKRPGMGNVAMTTQSGTVGISFMEMAERVGLSKLISYGNRIDVDEGDLLAYLAEDEKTDVIACYIEGLDDGRKFLKTAREVVKKKPIVVFKSGRSQRAATAAVSHTGFFGGSYGVTEGAFKQAGVIAVDSMEEMVAVSKALAFLPRAKGYNVGMMSNGAGTMVQGIDQLEELGLHLVTLQKETIDALKAIYPPFYLVQNPLDLTGSSSDEDYVEGIKALIADPGVDIVMVWFVLQSATLTADLVDKVAHLVKTSPKPILLGSIGSDFTQMRLEEFEDKGIPVFRSVRDWAIAARGLADYSKISK